MIAIVADVLLVRTLATNKTTYFRSYRDYFVTIYLTFLAFPAGDLSFIFFAEPPRGDIMRLAWQSMVAAGCTIATIWGYLAVKLSRYPEPLSLTRIAKNIHRPDFLLFLLYLVPMIFAVMVGLFYEPAITVATLQQVDYVLDAISLPSVGLSIVFVGAGALVVVAFTVYPLVILTRLRSKLKDEEVRSAFNIFSVAFSLIAVTLMVSVGLSSIGYSIRSSANIVSVLLIFVAVRAFKKPTFLKSFLGVVPSLESSPLVSHTDQMVLLYNSDIDKFGPLAKYIVDAATQQDTVFYFHRGDDTQIREDLKDHGVDVRQFMVKGTLRLFPLGNLYQTKGSVDETAIDYVLQLVDETRKLGRHGIRLILDFDDYIVRPIQKFISHLTDPRWTSPDHYIHILMAFRSSAFRADEGNLNALRSRVRILDLSESMNAFSKTVGLSHSEFAGKKILIEFDPRSDYDRIVNGILAESASNFERTVIFTRRGSPMHSLVQKQPGAKLFVLTSKVSYPKIVSDNRVLLPAYDTSLVLDSLNRTIEAYLGSAFTIVFDDVSHYIFTLGLDRGHSFVRQAIELMGSANITSVFLLNAKAHDEKGVSSFESLFDIEIVCEAGIRLPEIKRTLAASLA